MYLKTIKFIVLIFSLVSCGKKIDNKQGGILKEDVPEIEQKLSSAFNQRDTIAILKMIQAGMNPDISIDDQPLLIQAVINSWDELVIILVNNGVGFYCKSKDTPFFCLAASKLQESTLLYIIDKGFDITKLSNKEIKDVFINAIFREQINFQKRLIKIDGAIEKLLPYNDLVIYLIRYWIDGTGDILGIMLEKGFMVPNGYLYYNAVTENSYEAVEWLISQGFSTTILYDGETISYWADLNLSRRRKNYDDTGSQREDSLDINNAQKIKKLIEANL